MLAHIALFEFRYQLRGGITWVSFAIFALLAYGLTTLMGIHGNEVNAPGLLAVTVSLFGFLAMFLSIATIADVALRDSNSRVDAILQAMPVRPSIHYGPRLAGAYVVAAIAFLGVMIGNAAGAAMPWIPAVTAGPFRLDAHAMAFAVMALPTLFATGALFFTIATLTQRLMATYLAGIVLLALFMAANTFSSLGHPTIAALLDPFGFFAFAPEWARWDVHERMFRSLPLDGLLLWNRLLWIGIGCALLTLSFTVFSARERRSRAMHVDAPARMTPHAMLDRPIVVAGSVGTWDQLVLRTRYETRTVLGSWTFIALLMLCLLMAAATLFTLSLTDLVPNSTHTPMTVAVIARTFGLIIVLLPIAYSGELIWRDREAKIAQIIDATVAPNIVFLASKLIAMTLVIVTLLTIAISTGIVFQLIKGAESIDIGLHLIKLGMFVGLPALLYGVLSVFVQTVVNRKFVGLLIMLAVLSVMSLAPGLISNPLLLPFTIPDPGMTSDYSAYIRSLWVAGYWTSIALLIAMVAHLLWVRGTASLWTRLERVHDPVMQAAALVAVLAVAGFAATGYLT
jgi:hypothetical protein